MRSLLVLSAAGLLALSHAAAPISASGSFFALSVADIDASAKWYSDVFDMKTVMHVPKQSGSEVTVLQGSGLMVELIHSDSAVSLATIGSKSREAVGVYGIAKAGILVDDFDRTVETLRAKHVTFAYGPFPARGDQKANVIIRDNAGNLIQIVAR